MEVQHVTLGEGGRIVIPAAFRKALGVKPGDQIALYKDEKSELHIKSLRQFVEDMRAEMAPYFKDVPSVVDEFLAWRKLDSGE